MTEAKALSVSDADNIYKAVLEMVMKYPSYPEMFEASNQTVKWDSINTDASIGLFSLPGAIYLKEYVSGSYKAQFPFRIVYKSSPTSNKTTMEAQILVENLAKYLEKCTATFKDKHIKLEKIVRTSPVSELGTKEKEKAYSCTMQLQYFYKK